MNLKSLIISLLLLLPLACTRNQSDPTTRSSSRAAKLSTNAFAQSLYSRVSPSLVAVQYTWDHEQGRRELIGQGLVIAPDGTIMTSMSLFPKQVPDQQMRDFKIIVPGDEQTELDAVFLGRDERSDTAFLRVKETAGRSWTPISFEEAPPSIAEPIYSVGLLPKEAGYKPYYTEAFVSAELRGPTPSILVSPDGLAGISSPVFNKDGKAIGFVPWQLGLNFLLNNPQGGQQGISMPPPRMFTPSRDFLPSIADLPREGEPIKLPWMGAAFAGITKEVQEYYNLKGTAVAQVGEVLSDSPAQKAGLKPSDKIIKVNGQPLERGDDPAEVPQIMVRKLRRQKPGDKITLTVLRERDKPPIDIEMTLEELPKQAHQAARFYADDLGMSVRELVFDDRYNKKLAASAKGVVVAYIRQASSAASASLKNGDVITELNSKPVESLEQFKEAYSAFRKDNPKDLVVLVVVREGNTQVIKIEPPQ